MDGRETDGKQVAEERIALKTLILIVGGGFLSTVVYALQAATLSQFASILSVAILIGGAALLVGGLLGFLFGIPRTYQSDRVPEQPASDNEEGEEQRRKATGSRYQANTNLEQISDWLAKILVGVGLTQLTAIPEALKQFSEYVAPGLGGFRSSLAFGVSMPVFFLVCGFLFGYLWTRIYLLEILKRADEFGQLKQQIHEIKSQAEKDLLARNLTEQQLSEEVKEVPQNDLTKAITEATLETQLQIFYRANNVRRSTWRDNKPHMERTIPVFRAFLDSNVEEIIHWKHAQLAYALKDKRKPEFTEALMEINKAIEIRDQLQETAEFPMYDFTRALIMILMDRSFKEKKPSSQDSKEKISADLKTAAKSSYVSNIITTDQKEILDWMKINQVTKRSIGIR
jgi:hypothetical protein